VGAAFHSAEQTLGGRASGSRAEQLQSGSRAEQLQSGTKHARFLQTPPMCGGVPVRRSPLKRRVQLEPPPSAATRPTDTSAAPVRAANSPHTSPHTPVLQQPPPTRSRLGPHARANYVSYATAPFSPPSSDAAAASTPRCPVPIAAPAPAAAALRKATRTPCAAAIAPCPASSGPHLAAKWQLLEELFAGVCTVYPVLRARSMQVCIFPPGFVLSHTAPPELRISPGGTPSPWDKESVCGPFISL
jgi:hypothetical protein